jgi:sec-independent protein translocase protein TatB
VFNVGPEKLVFLFVIALVVLGPQRLPGAARSLGKAVAELRRLSGNLQHEVRGALGEPGDALSEAVTTLRDGLGGVFTAPEPGSPSGTPSLPPGPGPGPRTGALSSGLAGTPPAPDDPSLN